MIRRFIKFDPFQQIGKVHLGGVSPGHMASADVFVFPSLTDTFGVVLIEAMACGVPVAAYPVTGPDYLVTEGVNGAIDKDLRAATLSWSNLNTFLMGFKSFHCTMPPVQRDFAASLCPGGGSDPAIIASPWEQGLCRLLLTVSTAIPDDLSNTETRWQSSLRK
jgi:Glycosyl transferases group 1